MSVVSLWRVSAFIRYYSIPQVQSGGPLSVPQTILLLLPRGQLQLFIILWRCISSMCSGSTSPMKPIVNRQPVISLSLPSKFSLSNCSTFLVLVRGLSGLFGLSFFFWPCVIYRGGPEQASKADSVYYCHCCLPACLPATTTVCIRALIGESFACPKVSAKLPL